MEILGFDHVSIRVADLERTRDFYTRVIGLTVGPRPALPFEGYWFYCGAKPVIHTLAPDYSQGAGAGSDSGNFDHVSFSIPDFDAARLHLRGLGVPFEEQYLENVGIGVIFIKDPNNVTVELNYRDRSKAQ